MTDRLKNAMDKQQETRERTPDAPRSLPALLNTLKPEMARALPAHLNADRMLRLALTSIRLNPKIGQCEPRSILAAIIQASQLGLEIGVGGQAYLIPYGEECQFVPGWQGLVDLVSRAGRAACWTGAVYGGDDFDFSQGDSPFVKHRPGPEFDDEAKLRYVYAVGRVNNSQWPIIEVWHVAKARAHLQRYNKVGKRHYAHENFEMYARKIALLQVIKYLPKSPHLLAAVMLDNVAGRASQGLTIEGTATQPFELGLLDGMGGDGNTGGNNTTTGDAEGGDGGKGEGSGTQAGDAGARPATDKSGAPNLDADKIIATMKSRTDVDVLDADASVINALPGDDRERVRTVYTARRAELVK
jgi:recombination protein RecT